jgi:Na+/H+ antiporter NhaD/arsenite permease-like protein
MLIIIVFCLGYLFIALEHKLHIDKAASALLTGVFLWTILIVGHEYYLPEALSAHGASPIMVIEHDLMEHLSEISAILFFLLGAMTIVELIDTHGGFKVITSRIHTSNKLPLLWILSIVTFFLSAILDNLTTTIVMATLLRKLIKDRSDLWFFAGFIVIAANAGGAWSPIGDVTTIMLWIGGQITAFHIITAIFLPSLVCMLVPLGLAAFFVKGKVNRTEENENNGEFQISEFDRNLVFSMGVGALLFVPVFKSITHLPPFMGILFGLGVLWLTTELLHRKKNTEERHLLSVANTIRKIDTPSVLFFLGILLAVGALQTAGHLALLAGWLEKTVGDIYVINTLIGLLSAVVDNVPLVAGAMGMYSLDVYPQDHVFWTFLAYCAGTGGSALIIGSAAGVAIMGILKIDFLWYLKRITWLAVAGYFAGIAVYMLFQ